MPPPGMTPVTDDKPPETTTTILYRVAELRPKIGGGANGLGRDFGPLLGGKWAKYKLF
jgi:hypothetical protein